MFWTDFSTSYGIMRKEAQPIHEHLIESIPAKVKLLKHKSTKGFPLEVFYQEGNGRKALLRQTGRLMDLKGVFLIKGKDRFYLAFSSENVLKEIQMLVRGSRKKDEELLKQVADHFGFLTSLAGQEYLRSMEVTWLEVSSEAERLLLTRALNRSTLLRSA